MLFRSVKNQVQIGLAVNVNDFSRMLTGKRSIVYRLGWPFFSLAVAKRSIASIHCAHLRRDGQADREFTWVCLCMSVC